MNIIVTIGALIILGLLIYLAWNATSGMPTAKELSEVDEDGTIKRCSNCEHQDNCSKRHTGKPSDLMYCYMWTIEKVFKDIGLDI